MTANDIYQNYKITPSLQQHISRVAGLAQVIMDGWKGDFPIDKDAVIQACLFHDIAKIISFKTFKDGEKELQQEFIAKWGDDEHLAANKLVAEIGLLPHAQELIIKNNVKPFLEKIRAIMQSTDYEMKIVKYADSRIAPQGLVTLQGRWEELIARRSEKEGDIEANHIMGVIEDQLQKQTKTDLHAINSKNIDGVVLLILETRI